MSRILDWNKYIETAVNTIAEGVVMLRNDNCALPLDTAKEIAVFGRTQFHYYKSGTGSGGMVNVAKVVGIPEGLVDEGVKINNELLEVYTKWEEENPIEKGTGWGKEPWSQKEMPLDDELVKRISDSCETAVILIGRTAGEEQDNTYTDGAYLLSQGEKDIVLKVREAFKKVVVVLNVGNIIDMEYFEEVRPDAILYAWQGGMLGGTGTAKVLVGKVNPCGKLPDTIAKKISDFPSDSCFGDRNRNFYEEDIYVGYRYFETFAKDKVRYPFGFGLSYTDFAFETVNTEYDGDVVSIDVKVTNTGKYSGKEVVQVYLEAPQGQLGKAARVLCGFEKTKSLECGESQVLSVKIRLSEFASYDDSGVTGNKSCYVLEAGKYSFYVGKDSRNHQLAFFIDLAETVVTEKCNQALAPVLPFERIKAVSGDEGYAVSKENVPFLEIDEAQRRIDNLPAEIPVTGDKGIKFCDVKNGKATLDEFVAQLSDKELASIIRGEGMGSPRVTAGTASAFGGITDDLESFGIPAACCSDGPSGMRLDCGTKVFSIPNGTMIASTFNKELITELFTFMGLEMRANKVDCLLGPGMNIHRHPLNGRNFEYFSEDPFLTGMIASSELMGLHSVGVEGTIKHFCGNNQETNRHFLDSVVSERALREIYLKGFEIAVKKGDAKSIMSTYCSLNGVWTAGNFDQNTMILRNEWGYDGFVMTDWWANINVRGGKPNHEDFAAMARAQNDVYMCCADCSNNNDNTMESLEYGTLTRAELQRNAKNILRFLLNTHALKRYMGEEEKIEIINRPAEEAINEAPVTFYEMDEELTVDLSDIPTDGGTDYSFGLTANILGGYDIVLTASSDAGELAQIPVTLFMMGTNAGTFTWNGTNGKPVSFEAFSPVFSRYTTVRLHFAQSGLKMESITFKLKERYGVGISEIE
ncbi:MAG: beta-glucosidase [Ruminococcus sp.]|nr:beta-glucosidase [Ruminococcus sp.]